MSKTPIDNYCEQVKAVLVDYGQLDPAKHAELAAHAESCQACRALMHAWNAIPDLLEQLPDRQPAQGLVERVQEEVAKEASFPSRNASRRRFLAPSLASAAVLVAAFGISYQLMMQEKGPQLAPADFPRASGQVVGQVGEDEGELAGHESGRGDHGAFEFRPNAEPTGPQPSDMKDNLEDSALIGVSDASRAGAVQPLEEAASDLPDAQSPGFDRFSDDPEVEPDPDGASRFGNRDAQLRARRSEETERNERAQRGATEHLEIDSVIVTGNEPGDYAQAGDPAEQPAAPPPAALEGAEKFDEDGEEIVIAKRPAVSPETSYFRSDENVAGEDRKKEANQTANRELSEARGLADTASESGTDGRTRGSGDKLSAIGGSLETLLVPEFDFLAHYQRTDGLAFQPATGYWSNSYVPGDPEIRLLNARLAEWDRSWLPDPALERAVKPIAQPFDAPDDHALALSLMADAAAIPADIAPTRFRVQVGIQGIEHRRGTRPAMNLAMVVDIPPQASDGVRISANALIDALLASKQAGDRFSLVLTGHPGFGPGLVVAPDEFRFGSLDLAKQVLNARAGSHPELPVRPADLTAHREILDPLAAMQQATALVRPEDENDDEVRPLGSSAVVLLTARELAGLDALAALAHSNARDGITLSVVPLGNGASNAQAEQLVLAGLGQRRYLEAPAEARDLIENELNAASQAVARAARLSIRLAPGVRLIDVIDSERLDTERAQRVRDIENAMDRRLAQHLGIQADRGEDEDGIQIVIPSIYSGDAVTILLDVVAEGPGPVAEVTLRYKDLVYRRNGTLHGQLALPRSDQAQPAPDDVRTGVRQPPRGPAEYSVLKNLLAHHFTAAIEHAAEALGNGQPEAALEALQGIYATYEWLRLTLPALNEDSDLIRDQNVLERYMEALRAPGARENAAELADSLRLAAWAKTHGQPETWQ